MTSLKNPLDSTPVSAPKKGKKVEVAGHGTVPYDICPVCGEKMTPLTISTSRGDILVNTCVQDRVTMPIKDD
jgi:hypothetical protein